MAVIVTLLFALLLLPLTLLQAGARVKAQPVKKNCVRLVSEDEEF